MFSKCLLNTTFLNLTTPLTIDIRGLVKVRFPKKKLTGIKIAHLHVDSLLRGVLIIWTFFIWQFVIFVLNITLV